MKADITFSYEAPEDSPGLLLWQTTITWQRQIKKALDPYDIAHAQFVIMAITLWFEEHHQNPTQVLIANISKLDKMTVSKALKKLTSMGYINRTESKLDTRAKWIGLTSKGKALIQKLVPIVEGIDEKFFGILPKNDYKELVRILGKVNGKL